MSAFQAVRVGLDPETNVGITGGGGGGGEVFIVPLPPHPANKSKSDPAKIDFVIHDNVAFFIKVSFTHRFLKSPGKCPQRPGLARAGQD
jgi:hypothetical protein